MKNFFLTSKFIVSVFVLNIFCLSAKAQKDSTFSRWSLGISITANENKYLFNTIEDENNNPQTFTNKTDWAFGNVLFFHFNKKIFLQSGFNVTENNFIGNNSNTSSNYPLSSFYLEIPLQFGYTIFNKKYFSINVNAGCITSFYLIDSYYESESTYLAYQQLYHSNVMEYINGGFSLVYKINSKINIALSPLAKYDFNKVYLSIINKNLISYGSVLSIYKDL